MKLATIFAAAAALVLTACENPVQPPFGGAPLPSAPTRSVAAETTVHMASTLCQNTWGDGWFCSLTVTSTGVPYVAAAWTDWNTYSLLNAPTWSPDATKIAFTDGSEVQVVSLIDGRLTNLTNHPAVDASPAWSPERREDGVSERPRRRGGAVRHERRRVERGTPHLQHGVNTIVPDPDWAPDGTRIIFTCEVESGNADICRINADGTGLVRLTSEPTPEYEPAWSPDGSRIVFVSGSQLRIMNADGSGAIQVSWATGFPRRPTGRRTAAGWSFRARAKVATAATQEAMAVPTRS